MVPSSPPRRIAAAIFSDWLTSRSITWSPESPAVAAAALPTFLDLGVYCQLVHTGAASVVVAGGGEGFSLSLFVVDTSLRDDDDVP